MISRVFVDQYLPDSGQINITKAEHIHHLKRVLRVKRNDQVRVFGCCRKEYIAVIQSISDSLILLELQCIIERPTESPITIMLGQSVSRGQRMDYSIQKATELGVATVAPVYTEHCQVRFNEQQAEKKQRHWASIARNATEQSGRLVVPDVGVPQQLESWLEQINHQVRLVLHESCQQLFDSSIETASPKSVAVLIGPEGGLSEREIMMAQDYGFTPVQLGPRVLRTETAAPVMLTLIQWFWGDFGG